MTFGFDVSTWQNSPLVAGDIDFQKMKDYGSSFVIIRAGQGNWKDDDFDKSWDNAKGILPRNSYFFYDNRYKPQVQARNYFEIIKRDPEGFCWLDLEHTVQGDYGRWEDWYDFLAEFHSLCKYPVGIYTGYWYFTDRVKFATSYQKQFFSKYPLWLASYPADPFNVDHSQIRIPYPWTRYVMLQSGTPAIGLDAGVESREIDYNIWMKDTEFATFFGTAPTIPDEPTEPEGEIMQGRVLVNLNIRKTPGTTFTPIGQLAPQDIVEGMVLDGGWWRLSKWTRAGQLLPLPAVDCYAYQGAASGYIVEIEPPAPPATFPPRIGYTLDGTTIKWYVPE
jgi:hypothetical protein